MAISYPTRRAFSAPSDKATALMAETQARFQAESIDMFGPGFQDILSNDALFDQYVESLGQEFATNDQAAQFAQLAHNDREVALEAAVLGSVAPYSSLMTPMLRKSWAKLAMPHALPTVAVESPKFTLNYWQPWIKDQSGVKKYVPEDLLDVGDAITKVQVGKNADLEFAGQTFVGNLLTGKVTTGTVVVGGTSYAAGSADSFNGNLQALIKDNDILDVNASITKVKFSAATALAVGAKVTDVNGNVLTIKATPTTTAGGQPIADALTKAVNLGIATRTSTWAGKVSVDVELVPADFDETITANAIIRLEETVFGKLDLQTGEILLTAAGENVSALQVRSYVSSVMNNFNSEVGFDVIDKEVQIGTAPHISCPAPNEYVTDLLRMFQFNGVTKLVEIMSNFVAQKVDLDGIDFIKQNLQDYNDITKGRFHTRFSVKPVGNFMGSPTEWRKEIKVLIDHLADDLISYTMFETGHFVILGHPIDIRVLQDVNWTFTNSSEREVSGVPVSFALGKYQGAYVYDVIGSPNVPQGYLTMYFLPSNEDQMTYKFFPYSFTVEQPGSGYNNPNAVLVPSIMCHRRYGFEKVLQCISSITITNNSPEMYSFSGPSPYLPTDDSDWTNTTVYGAAATNPTGTPGLPANAGQRSGY